MVNLVCIAGMRTGQSRNDVKHLEGYSGRITIRAQSHNTLPEIVCVQLVIILLIQSALVAFPDLIRCLPYIDVTRAVIEMTMRTATTDR